MTERDQRVLVLAGTRKDGLSTQRLLESSEIQTKICSDLEDLVAEIAAGAGAILLAKEAIRFEGLKTLAQILAAQPSWSHIPLILLMSEGDMELAHSRAKDLFRALRNITFLERPVRVMTLLSVVEAALADRRRQYETRDLVEALEYSREQAIRANRTKSEFLANMSHEIRTPLGVVIGFAELLARPDLSRPDRINYTEMIRRNGKLLLDLVNDILDLAKVEAGKVSVERLSFNLHDLIGEVIDSLASIANNKSISLEVEGLEALPRIVRSDPLRFKQILMNVVGNAIKFTHQGKVTLKCSTRYIPGEGSRILVDVCDTGVGISTLQRQRLFQAFSQADSSTTRAYGGTGLGLVLARELSRLLGGDLTLQESEVGVGSCFRIETELSHSFEETLFGSPLPESHYLHANLGGLKVLVVDDSLDNQVLIRRLLDYAGIEVDVACDGIEAVDKALRGNFDVILMDIQMPRLDGRGATAKLRSLGYARPIVALTAHALSAERELSLKVGCNDYLVKPIDRELLYETLGIVSGRISPSA